MKIRINQGDWQDVILFDPPSKTVTVGDGTVWHISRNRNEILELGIFITRILEKHAPWEIADKRTLALSRGRKSFPEYEIETEEGDARKYEMFYFYKFTAGEADYLTFPDHLLQGVCVRVETAAMRYFLADTLFFDFLISKSTSEESVDEVCRNMTKMKKKWDEMRKTM